MLNVHIETEIILVKKTKKVNIFTLQRYKLKHVGCIV